MPSKTTTYPRVHFVPDMIEDAFKAFHESATRKYVELRKKWHSNEPDESPSDYLTHYARMSIDTGRDHWTFDTEHEFFEELRKEHNASEVHFETVQSMRFTYSADLSVSIYETEEETRVVVTHPDKAEVSRMSRVFESAASKCQLSEPSPPPVPKPRIFVGHGGSSSQWRNLKDHLADVHGYEVVAFESGARAGNAIRDILSGMLDASTFAILVMTGEDVQNDGTMRARQNVVHEAGLFQGRLGFSRAIILLESGTENFSNLDGIQYIPFSEGNIRETFGDVLGTLRREFPAA